jgi:predicted amidohydrolase
LFVLPELCFSGYTFTSKEEVYELSEGAGAGPAFREMAKLAMDIKSAIVFGFPERSGDDLYNSCAMITPGSNYYIYRKLHPFMHEKEWFKPGDKPLDIYEVNGCRIGLMVCFDWRFPEVARTLALKGAHVLCHPANLVMPHCQAAMVTRCLENRVFAITANRTGRESRGRFEHAFTGSSQIVDPRGNVIATATKDKDEVIIADIDYRESEDKAVTPNNDIWADRRPDFYFR